jgi:hypothetical protein
MGSLMIGLGSVLGRFMGWCERNSHRSESDGGGGGGGGGCVTGMVEEDV